MESSVYPSSVALMGVVTLIAQAPPLDANWLTYLLQGGATAAVMATASMMLWYADKERKAERIHREKISKAFAAATRVTNICILENAEQSARCSVLLEALTPFVKKGGQSQSQVLKMQEIEQLKKELQKEHEEHLLKDKNEEDSQEK